LEGLSSFGFERPDGLFSIKSVKPSSHEMREIDRSISIVAENEQIPMRPIFPLNLSFAVGTMVYIDAARSPRHRNRRRGSSRGAFSAMLLPTSSLAQPAAANAGITSDAKSSVERSASSWLIAPKAKSQTK
jgi:hypothetical protein